jgi:LacI family transcriptional regulator
MAMGTYDALRRLNLSIPGDVAVMGFDNQQFIASNLYPALSTMELPHYEMGVRAARLLMDLMDGLEDEAPSQHRVLCPFIERESV